MFTNIFKTNSLIKEAIQYTMTTLIWMFVF